MKTSLGHLGYCTNIHAGEHWAEHFISLQKSIPAIKQQLSPDAPFGIGLRLSNIASLELAQNEAADGVRFREFQQWLAENDCYVFTMNGFPYGGFHRTRVKDHVHAPDWRTPERVDYTIRLFRLLSKLLPKGQTGGISTSPLSYRYWFRWDNADERDNAFEVTTQRLMTVVEELVRINDQEGIKLHLDLEPEPDGLLETGDEFIDWFNLYLLPIGIERLNDAFGMTAAEAEAALREHVQLCYDVCHFAVGYERPEEVLQKLETNNLKVGKIQISAALKATFPVEPNSRVRVRDQFVHFDESTYLHQVVAMDSAGQLLRFPDLPQALQQLDDSHVEWRAHFHVPIFVKDYGLLQSTQQDIIDVLQLQKDHPFTEHLEVETYTWDVLPPDLKIPISDSIGRELEWVINTCL